MLLLKDNNSVAKQPTFIKLLSNKNKQQFITDVTNIDWSVMYNTPDVNESPENGRF